MALQDILNAITADTQKKISEIEKQGTEQIKKQAQIWDEKIEKRKKELLDQVQKKVDDKIRQSSFVMQSKVQAKIITRKREVIKEIYEKTLSKLTSLPEDKYIELLTKLLEKMPKDSNLTLLTSKKDKSVLEKALKKAKMDIKTDPQPIKIQGGFIAKSEKLEIDNSFEALINSVKEKNLVEITKLLFSY